MRFYYRLVAGRGGVLVLGTLEAWVGRGAAGIGVGCRMLGWHDCVLQPSADAVPLITPMLGQAV